MTKKEKKLFYSTSEEDENDMDADSKIAIAGSTKTLVDVKNDETLKDKSCEPSKVGEKSPTNLMNELASKIGTSRSNFAQNGFGSSSEDVSKPVDMKNETREPINPIKLPFGTGVENAGHLETGKERESQGTSKKSSSSSSKLVNPVKQNPVKSIFDSGSSSDAAKSPEIQKPVVTNVTREQPVPFVAKSKNLFDSDSDSDDLFSSAPKLVKPALASAKPVKNNVESSEQVYPPTVAANPPKPPQIVVKSALQAGAGPAGKKPTSLFSSDEETETLEKSILGSASDIKSSKSLFDDSSSGDDEDIDVLFKKAATKMSPKNLPKSKETKDSLFSDSSDDEEQVFVATVKVSSNEKLAARVTPDGGESKLSENQRSAEKTKIDVKKMDFLTKASILESKDASFPPENNTSKDDVEGDDDVTDGNILSAKKKDSKKFKDVLSEKLLKGPKILGKPKLPSAEATSKPLQVEEKLVEQKAEIPKNESKAEQVEVPKRASDEIKDEPQTSETLDSLTKNRAKLPNNRRPPTRKGMKKVSEDDQTDSADQPVRSSSVASANPDFADSTPSERASPREQPPLLPIVESDLSSKISDKIISIRTDHLPEVKKAESYSKLPVKTEPTSENSLLVNKLSTKSPESSSQDHETTKPTSTKSPKVTSKPATTVDPNVSNDDDDDDLFSPPPMPDVIKSVRQDDPLFGSSDDDDLFGDAKALAKTGTSTSRGIFDDSDDDDLFKS